MLYFCCRRISRAVLITDGSIRTEKEQHVSLLLRDSFIHSFIHYLESHETFLIYMRIVQFISPTCTRSPWIASYSQVSLPSSRSDDDQEAGSLKEATKAGSQVDHDLFQQMILVLLLLSSMVLDSILEFQVFANIFSSRFTGIHVIYGTSPSG